MTAALHWFPFYVKDWLSSPAVLAMLPEQRGGYVQLLVVAWADGDHEPWLPMDDASLAHLSGLNNRWKKLGPLVRAQFEERSGRLVNVRQVEVWHEQQAKYAVILAKASAGGKAKARNRRASSSASSSAPGTAPSSASRGASRSANTEGSSSLREERNLQNDEKEPAALAPEGALAGNGEQPAVRLHSGPTPLSAIDWREMLRKNGVREAEAS